MLPFYREITYRTWTPEFHEDVQDRFDDLSSVDILLARMRPLSWLERDALFCDQFACRVILAIVSREDDITVALTRGGDPYRATFDEFIREVRPDVRALIDDIGAKHREVTKGRLTFRTKGIPGARAHSLEKRFVPFSREMGVKLEISSMTVDDQYALAGRAVGSILGVHRLSHALLSSPFVVRQHLAVAFE